MNRLALVLATCGYVGYMPIAPGTAGSVVGLALFAAVRGTGSAVAEVALVGVLAVIGVWSASAAGRQLGSLDPAPVVIDEVVGMLLTLLLVPVNVAGACLGFLVFRVLDVVKPWPARRLEALPGGLGVVADDGMAAVYGNLVMRGAIALAPGWFA